MMMACRKRRKKKEICGKSKLNAISFSSPPLIAEIEGYKSTNIYEYSDPDHSIMGLWAIISPRLGLQPLPLDLSTALAMACGA